MATGMCAASSSVFPLDLPVHLLLPSGTQAHSVWLTAQDAEATTVLSLAQRFLPDASPLQVRHLRCGDPSRQQQDHLASAPPPPVRHCRTPAS